MLAAAQRTKNTSPISAIWQRCRDWIRANPMAELACCGDEEVERMARDFRMSGPEFIAVASRGSGAADLLLQRMAALDLDRDEVARVQPRALQDLQRVCIMCDGHRRCARDLARDLGTAAWKDYCPNVATLMALDTLPWASRRDW